MRLQLRLGVLAAVPEPVNPSATAKPLAQQCQITSRNHIRNHTKPSDFGGSLSARIAKHYYLQHIRPKTQLYLAAGGGYTPKRCKSVSIDKKRVSAEVGSLPCRREALSGHSTS